jgi:hypothetical protein
MPRVAFVGETFNVTFPEFVPILGEDDFAGVLKEMKQAMPSIILERERSHCIQASVFVLEHISHMIG